MSDYEGGSKHNSRGSERESSWRDRERDRGQEREKDGGRYTREYKDRSGRFDRGRNSYNGYRHSRNEDFDRHRDYDQDRERRHRHRSRSRSPSSDRSPSRSRSKSKRTSGFDMAPPAGSVLPNAPISDLQMFPYHPQLISSMPMMSKGNVYAPDALFRWGVALQQRSRLRPSNGKEKVKLLEQAKRLYEDALDMDSNNVQVREALSSCVLELGSRRLYS